MSVTPMMAQYLDIKSSYPNELLFYRMGDFYEMFFQDAEQAAAALDITLTKRGKHDGADIPMCGVPVHASDAYLQTLIRKGFRVAVCEQLESPADAKKRGSKAVVRRDVVRIVTPGTLSEDALLEARQNNYLAAISSIRNQQGLAWADMSTGLIQICSVDEKTLESELARIQPSEVLISERTQALMALAVSNTTTLPDTDFSSDTAYRRLCELYDVTTLDGFGELDRSEISSLGALLGYLDHTQKGQMPIVSRPRRYHQNDAVQIDPATRNSLELTRGSTGGRENTLLSIIDKTLTAPGGRLMSQWLHAPSRNLDIIQTRQEAVGFLVQSSLLRDDIRSDLKAVPDLERALSRLTMRRGSPRDLGAIRDGLTSSQSISARLASFDAIPSAISSLSHELETLIDLEKHLSKTLVETLPLKLGDGDVVASGIDEPLDEARRVMRDGKSLIAGLQSKYQSLTGVSSLKIKHNNVLGYFVEVTTTHRQRMASNELADTFIPRQSTANQVRFTTHELSDLEQQISSAGAVILGREQAIFDDLSDRIVSFWGEISALSSRLSSIDVYSALAETAVNKNWSRPTLDESRAFKIVDGRHPVVEASLDKTSGDNFVANSCDLSADGRNGNLWLLTGPNMAGKSTFLRQNAILAILAQIGSFVPARFAHIGIVSQIFSRVGASDDLAAGRSTFMVEMVETAAILNQADERALVILDEIGRGTATYDGLSIAWAVLEYLHDKSRCRGIFATHYHELTHLAKEMGGIKNATVMVKEWENSIIFLHEVQEGAADRSYGVQVAKLAGLPDQVTSRAKQILMSLEQGKAQPNRDAVSSIEALPLFSAAIETGQTVSDPLRERLDDISPDALSPRAALDLVYELKELGTK